MFRPHTARAGIPASRAAVATPIGALPCRLCSSSDPSPVMTRSASGKLAPEVDEVEDGVDPGPGRWPREQTSRQRRFPLPRPPPRCGCRRGLSRCARPAPTESWRPPAQPVPLHPRPFGVRRQRWRRSDRAADCRRRRLAGIAPRAPPGAGRSDPRGLRGAAPPRRARRRFPGHRECGRRVLAASRHRRRLTRCRRDRR